MKKLFLLLFLISCGCNDSQMQDRIHLQAIGASWNNCIQATGKLPENITKDEKPLLSWRVELLKYGSITEIELYKKFKLDEPWNSPHNLKTALMVPFMYVDPNGADCKPVDPIPNSILWAMNPDKKNFTPYLGVVGPKAAFRNSPREFKDDLPNYAAVVIVDKSDVFWTEPRDIQADKIKGIRWYKNKMIYLSTHGSVEDFDNVEGEIYNFQPIYEFKD